MDNILKLIVGCLGLVGLIVMLVPNSDPLASGNTDVEGPPPVASAGPDSAAPPPPPPAPQPKSDTGEFVVDDYDISSFGQPMVDPTPPGQRDLISQQQQNQQQQDIANARQPPLVGAASAGPAGPPPPPPITEN